MTSTFSTLVILTCIYIVKLFLHYSYWCIIMHIIFIFWNAAIDLLSYSIIRESPSNYITCIYPKYNLSKVQIDCNIDFWENVSNNFMICICRVTVSTRFINIKYSAPYIYSFIHNMFCIQYFSENIWIYNSIEMWVKVNKIAIIHGSITVWKLKKTKF